MHLLLFENWNEMSKGTTYYDLLRVFDIHDTMKNEQFIERYFKIM